MSIPIEIFLAYSGRERLLTLKKIKITTLSYPILIISYIRQTSQSGGKVNLSFIILSLYSWARNAWLHVIHTAVSNYPLPIGYDSSAITLTDIQHSHWLTQSHTHTHTTVTSTNATTVTFETEWEKCCDWSNFGALFLIGPFTQQRKWNNRN